jgi:hypothetical protein
MALDVRCQPSYTGEDAVPSKTGEHIEEKLKQVMVIELCQVVHDLVSCMMRVYVSYRLMIIFVHSEEAFYTGMLLGGASAFDPSTKWLQRSRRAILDRLHTRRPAESRIIIALIAGNK